jgi:kinesin family protein 2/24
MAELESEYQNEHLDGMCTAHNDLIKDIIDKEEDLISSHRTHIDAVVDIIKQDMSLLQVVDQPKFRYYKLRKEVRQDLIAKVEMIG